ncbi:MAG: MBL fold metallo-hydrolase [Clostridia bacterium]|nr:MBL fold metallo-hydrolase [Clostridia bacterium]
MRITESIYFYEGDYNYTLDTRVAYYKGMGSSNFLIIKGNEQVMIDSGMFFGLRKRAINKELYRDGIDLEKTTAVIFSHAHPDHVISAKQLCKKVKMQFFAHQDNEVMVRSETYFFEAYFNYPQYIRKEILFYPRWVVERIFKMFNFNFEYLKVNYFFNDRELLNYGSDIEVVSLSSHCPGHVGFYFPKEKVFYSGDLFFIECSEGVMINNALSSYEQSFRDISRVKQYDIEMLIPGHGKIVYGRENVQRVLEEVYQGTKDYLTKILGHLSTHDNGGLTLAELTGLIYEKFPKRVAFHHMSIVYNCLMYLRGKGNIDFYIKDKKAIWYRL